MLLTETAALYKKYRKQMDHSKKIAQIEVHAKEEAIMINDRNLPWVI